MSRNKTLSKNSILKSAKKFFLENGFEKTSMRAIAKEAGLTVGALYRYFESKSALFEALVEPTLNGAVELYNKELTLALNNLDTITNKPNCYIDEDSTAGILILEYIYEHYDIFDLMFNCSQGTKYERIQEFFVDMEITGTKRFIKALEDRKKIKNPFSERELHIFCTMGLTPLFEVISHKYSYEEAVKMVKLMFYGQCCAWNSICRIRADQGQPEVVDE
ncbi:MAG: helix-turn-helix domain-containing protein [Lachnospiraceae bacterium]|nr:helix-turn-helix domain containing protein [Lachnospiraceae bacterium]MDY5742984.1 helix-turn-helix domain-containing protein [Lachnospiraceae bacterium]